MQINIHIHLHISLLMHVLQEDRQITQIRKTIKDKEAQICAEIQRKRSDTEAIID